MENNELYHHGILGMKWGVRRYQNKDGSLTDDGRKRYDRDIQENNARKKDNRIDTSNPDPNRWVREDLTRSKKVVDTASNTVSKIDDFSKRHTIKTKKMDLNNMTDQQLRDRINRTLLEKQYTEMFAEPEKMSKGKQFVESTLKYAGGALTAASTVLGIALAIKELKG